MEAFKEIACTVQSETGAFRYGKGHRRASAAKETLDMNPTSRIQRTRSSLRHQASVLLGLACLVTTACSHSVSAVKSTGDNSSRRATPTADSVNSIPIYRARFDRARPVVAIVGENSGTELTDFVIPYGVLTRSGVADVVTVSTQSGVVCMRPALKVQTDATIAEFDAEYSQGADYVIVPAVVQFKDPALLAWVKSQGEKGATVMSICDGAAVVAGTGLMNGRRATAHWASEGNRRRLFPDVNWISNVRYVADGPVISTAGISAALPASIALVEAIAGPDRALALAQDLGTPGWSAEHDTAPFRPQLGVNVRALLAVTYTNSWFHGCDMIGLRIAEGVDEIAVAVTADAYSRTGRSMLHALSTSREPVRTRSGLRIVPDALGDQRLAFELPEIASSRSADAFPTALEGIGRRYGPNTAYGVALNLEYPMTSAR